MNITFITIIIVIWAVVTFSLTLPFMFGGNQTVDEPTITSNATEINNELDDTIGQDELFNYIEDIDPIELTDLSDGISTGPRGILPRGRSQNEGRPTNLKRRRIQLEY